MHKTKVAGFSILVLFAVAVVIAAFSLGLFSFYAHDRAYAEEPTVSSTTFEYEYRYNGQDVGIYYTGSADELPDDVSFRVSYSDGESEEPIIENFSTPFFSFNAEEAVDVTLRYVLNAGQVGIEAEGEAQDLEINTEAEIFTMAYPYRATYSGEEIALENVEFAGEAISAGVYSAQITCYEEPIGIEFTIDPAKVSLRVNDYSRVYMEEDTYIPTARVTGNITDDDKAYITEHAVFEYSVPFDSPIGTFPVKVTYTGDNDNFVVTAYEGLYTVKPARMFGFTMENLDVLYDGKPHRPQLVYDDEKWCGVKVKYNFDEMSDVGKYRYRCTVSLPNYSDLVVEATMQIRSRTMEGLGETYHIQINGNAPMGYDPEIHLTLVGSKIADLEELAEPLLKEEDGYKESVIGTYDVDMVLDGDNCPEFAGDSYSLRMRIYGLTSANGIRILKYNDGNLQEADYSFENGYFVLQTSSLDGFVFVKNFPLSGSSPANLISALIVGAVLLLVLIAVIAGLSAGSRRKRYYRRRHSKWV